MAAEPIQIGTDTSPDPIEAIRTAWEADLLSERYESTTPRPYVYASGRKACVRAMALDLIHPEDRPPAKAEQVARMERGKERERDILLRLSRVGARSNPRFDVTEGQRRFEVKDRDGVVLMAGKIDGRFKFHGVRDRPIFEIKSGDSFRNVETIEDLERSPWTRHTLDQLLSYLLAEGEEWGLLILDGPAIPRLLRVNLIEHLERAERFLVDARAAVDARFERAALPAFHQSPAECRRCDHFRKSCNPPIDSGAGAAVFTDERLIEAAKVRDANYEAAKKYEKADTLLKKELRGVELGIVGDFMVEGKWGKTTSYPIPEAEKAKYKVTDDKGRFSLSFTKLDAEPESEEKQ